eukprot:9866155-Lingulodinium_polyedra.AAC.1
MLAFQPECNVALLVGFPQEVQQCHAFAAPRHDEVSLATADRAASPLAKTTAEQLQCHFRLIRLVAKEDGLCNDVAVVRVVEPLLRGCVREFHRILDKISAESTVIVCLLK